MNGETLAHVEERVSASLAHEGDGERVGLQAVAGLSFGNYRFKLQPGQPQPDELKIVLTGKAMPEAFQRTALWSANFHGNPND